MSRLTMITLALTMALPLVGEPAFGQYGGGEYGGGQYYTSGDCGGCGQGSDHCLGFYSSNCGRQITTSQAAALWTGYCTEDCSFQGGCGTGCGLSRGCGLLHRGGGCGLRKGLFRNCRHASGSDCDPCGYDSCGSGCNSGCGVSAGCGCDGGYTSTADFSGCDGGYNGGCGCRLFSGHRRGCGCLSKLFRSHGGGCGCYQGCFGYGSRGYGGGGYASSDCGSRGGGCFSKLFGKCCLFRGGGGGHGCFSGNRSGGFGGGCCFSRHLTRAGRRGYDGGYFYDAPASCNSFNLYSDGCSGGCDGGSGTSAGPVPTNGNVGCTGNSNVGGSYGATIDNGSSFAPGGDVIQGQIQGNPPGDGSGGR